MKKLHYYQVLLALGSLLAGSLYAVNKNQDDHKSPEKLPQQASQESFYQHGDLTFFDRAKNNIDQEELKKRLINLSYRIKAKGKRNVYFFIGVAGSGKSLSIQALQGNKIKELEETEPDDSSSSSDADKDGDKDEQVQDKLVISGRIPRECKIPTVGSGCTGETDSTYIYYPDPRQKEYQGIAFADTEGFFGKRTATSAAKLLSATSFFYATKANNIGGLILVISASDLDAGRGEVGMQRIASILQQYFAKAVSKQKIRESILIMITKVATKEDKDRVKRKLRGLIQLLYQEYYTKPDDNDFSTKKSSNKVQVNKLISQIADEAANKVRHGVYNSLSWLTNNRRKLIEKDENFKKKVKKDIEKERKQRTLKLFYEMLLRQDVPEDKINDINNFKLNKSRYCFIFPWEEKSVKKILDKKLKNLKPIPSSDLCTFDNPVTQYIEARIYDFSTQLKEATQPLLSLRKVINTVKKELIQKTSKDAANDIETLEKNIRASLDKKIKHYNDRIKTIKNDAALEVVFNDDHYGNVPAKEGFLSKLIEGISGYKLYKEFRYTGKEPIYRISATYGPKSNLSEQLPSWAWDKKSEFNFIKKNFKIIREENDNGVVIWQAEAKNGKSVKKDEWRLYHFITGQHNAKCDIKFYARRNESISSKKRIQDAQDEMDLLQQKADECVKAINKSKEENKKWEKKVSKEGKKWEGTVHMLQFFADGILKEGAQQLHIKERLRNYNEARKLFLSSTINKKNNQKNKPQLEDLNMNTSKGALKLDACNQETDDNEVFDID